MKKRPGDAGMKPETLITSRTWYFYPLGDIADQSHQDVFGDHAYKLNISFHKCQTGTCWEPLEAVEPLRASCCCQRYRAPTINFLR